MNYLAVKDLKQMRVVREKLEKERELVVMKDGTPFAVLVGIEPDAVEESLTEIRRAMFSTAVMRVRNRVKGASPTVESIQKEIDRSREGRGLK
jgi:hypothetical protein